MGIVSTLIVRSQAETRERSELLTRADIAASAIESEKVKSIKGMPEDINNPQYVALKKIVTKVKGAQKDVRFVYLMGYNGDKLFFYVDSEAPDSPDYSAPGDVYYETNDLEIDAFKNTNYLVEGPSTDAWGEWVSAFAPIKDPETGQTLALLGIDVDAKLWRSEIFRNMLIPILITILFVSLLVLYAFSELRSQEIDRLKSEFVSMASHQLRTPLTGIKWSSELLIKDKSGSLSERQKDYVKQIADSNERMIKLVEDLLNVSHIETGSKFIINKLPIDLVPVINSIKVELAALADLHEVSVKISLPAKLIFNLDAEKIRQVLQNLMSNAVKYSKAGGIVEIGIFENSDENLNLFVKDNGLGIPENQQDRMFEKFFRADNVRSSETEGTGLGLYIAKAIVEGHGGRIWFESKKDEGTTFYIKIPKQSTKTTK